MIFVLDRMKSCSLEAALDFEEETCDRKIYSHARLNTMAIQAMPQQVPGSRRSNCLAGLKCVYRTSALLEKLLQLRALYFVVQMLHKLRPILPESSVAYALKL